jgi:glycosyltransferase involved in cell wall biosynthesis
MIRVAFISQTGEIGGAEIVLLHLLSVLDRKRFEPLVIISKNGRLKKRVDELGVKVFLLEDSDFIPTSFDLHAFRLMNPAALTYDFIKMAQRTGKLRVWLRSQRIDLVHTNGLFAHFYGGYAARSLGIPCIWHLHDMVASNKGLGTSFWGFNMAAHFLPSVIMAVSSYVSKSLHPYLRKKVRVVHNAIDWTEYIDENLVEAFRSSLNIPRSAPLLGAAGRLVPWKGHYYLFEAVKVLMEENPDVHMLVAGTPTFGNAAYEKRLKQRVRDFDLSDRIHFLGCVHPIAHFMQSIDVFVHTSIRPEPFGMVLLEAMAAGKPVIAAPDGGAPEIVLHGETGLLVNPRNTKNLSRGLSYLVENPQIRKSLGQAAKKRVQSTFSAEVWKERIQNIYLEFAQKA